jgi:hypothetical protein
MLKNSNKYYVYRHVRPDKNQVFYIGMGCGKRAKEKSNRNRQWHNIVNKVGYEVEIIMSGLTKEQAIDKEMEFIELYKSTVCNMTNGGEGFFNGTHTDEVKQRMSKARKLLYQNPEYKAKHSKTLHKVGGWNKGMKLPDDQKIKMSEAARNRAERKRNERGQYA